METKKVAIVGGGISGLLACKYALSKGYRPLVLESSGHLGGVWANTLETTRLQTPKVLYQFSDFPWPAEVGGMHPTGAEVRDYVRSYAHRFGLLAHVRLNTKVLSIDYHGASAREIQAWTRWGGTGQVFGNNGKWTLLLQDVHTLSEQVMQFDFVMLCMGRFSDLPKMPEFAAGEGPEVFEGKVIHSKDYKGDLVQGKRVVVVGFKKSAIDIAHECSLANGKDYPCHVIIRNPSWNLPDYTVWGMPLALLYFNRFAELLLHKPGEGLFLGLVATILAPLRWLIGKVVESNIRHKHPLKKFGIIPQRGFLESVSSCLLSVVPKGFYEQVEQGSIILKKAKSFSFCKQGVALQGEEKPLHADLVVLATGFNGDQKLGDIFASPMFKDDIMGSPKCIVPLYRQCIHPRIPQLAVIGYSESISNLYTSEMRCRWVMELLDGTFKLPTIKAMEEDIARWDAFMKTYSPKHYRRSCIGAVHIWYNDQLCKDMGRNPRRKKGFISDLFHPYGPLDYTSSS